MPVSLGMVDHTLPVPAAEIDLKTMVSTPLDDTDAEDIAVHLLLMIRRIAAEDILLTHEEEGTIAPPIRTMLLLTLDAASTARLMTLGYQPSPIGYDVPAPSQSAT